MHAACMHAACMHAACMHAACMHAACVRMYVYTHIHICMHTHIPYTQCLPGSYGAPTGTKCLPCEAGYKCPANSVRLHLFKRSAFKNFCTVKDKQSLWVKALSCYSDSEFLITLTENHSMIRHVVNASYVPRDCLQYTWWIFAIYLMEYTWWVLAEKQKVLPPSNAHVQ